MTDCGLKCFELQDTEHALAVEKENNQKLEAEVKRLKGIIETPCTSCCITESLEYSLDELNNQIVNQDREIRQLKEQITDIKEDVERERNKQRRLEHDFTVDVLNNLLNKWS